jgi:hypothetical protein
MLVSGPIIAHLLARPRMWALRQISDGHFGPVIERDCVLLVELARVEAVVGTTFSPAQLEAAGIWQIEEEPPDGHFPQEKPRTVRSSWPALRCLAFEMKNFSPTICPAPRASRPISSAQRSGGALCGRS